MEGLARSAMNIVNESAEYFIPLSWSMNNIDMSPGVQERFDFYQASILPTAYFGGTHLIEGWDCNLMTFNAAYESLETLESPFTIDLEFEQSREESFEISAEVTLIENIPVNNNKIFFVITNWEQYSIENPWFYLVVAKSIEEDVLITNMGETISYTTTLNMEIQPDWNLENLHAVAIIQDWDSQEILQAAQVNLISTGVNDPVVPAEISLHQNYPNPFNPSTTINLSLNKEQMVTLEIYNIKGEKVKQLVNSQLSAGQHSITWDGRDDAGKQISSGIYFYRMITKDYSATKRMIMLK